MNNNTQSSTLYTHILPVSANVIRVAYTLSPQTPGQSPLIAGCFSCDAAACRVAYCVTQGRIAFQNQDGETILEETAHCMTPKAVYRYEIDGDPILQTKSTANGEVAYIQNARSMASESAYGGKLVFSIAADEHLYGLGQHENGVYNYNGQTEYLYQTNMKISIPFLLSSKNYGILIDTETAMVFDCQNGQMSFTLDTVNELSYYVIIGDCLDALIADLRTLTGRAPMLPRWAFGYVQSKERYRSSEELLRTVEQFRAAGIPVDCIVQDWYTWPQGLWGEKHADPGRYPDLPALLTGLHARHAKLMVSIWPNMARGCANYQAFEQQGLLLPNSAVYNAFDERARALYWHQCEEDWFAAGADAWWCDNAEPFSDADWNGEAKRPERTRYQLILTDSQKSMNWTQLNTYGLFHAKGIYENWRKSTNAKRVVNLTRSTYASGQRYGVIAWSGDTSAKWSVLKNQIVEGIKFSMSGAPYWTLDIGGFFTVKDQYENRGCEQAANRSPLWFWDGDFNGGVNDLGYRELYVRWLQYAAFLPIFRSHGTDTPREPWRFGNPGDMFYDAILAFIRLRYRLLPYIYATAAMVYLRHGSMLRSLMFDFAQDERVRDACHSFMLGNALLVAPVTEPMYYGPNSTPLGPTAKTQVVYLPQGTRWYDFWTNSAFCGGQNVLCEAPIDRIPVFVKAGSIVPFSQPLPYADEQLGAIAEIYVYDGADGTFSLYNDAGDGYAYENGEYCVIDLTYSHANQTLSLGKAVGRFQYQEHFTLKRIADGGVARTVTIRYAGEATRISLA